MLGKLARNGAFIFLFFIFILPLVEGTTLTKIYNFSGITSPSSTHKAYVKLTDNVATPLPWTNGWDGSETDNTGYSNLASSDNNRLSALSGGSNREPWIRLNFTLDMGAHSLENMQWLFINMELIKVGGAGEDCTYTIANFSAGAWEEWGARATSTAADTTRTINYTSGFDNVIDNDQLVLLTNGINSDSNEGCRIDFAEIIVGYTEPAITIDFVSPTDADNDYFRNTRNFIQANASAASGSFANLTIYLYNSTSLVDSSFSTNANHFVNFTDLASGVYYINATAFESDGDSASTETRRIGIYDRVAFPGGERELRAQACNEENSATQNSYADVCDGTYPSVSCEAGGDRLGCSDDVLETADFNTNTYGGTNASFFNTEITNCVEIISVSVCYEWWRTNTPPKDCLIAVDADGGASYSTASSTCPGTTANPGITCEDVTTLESWECSNFFGESGTRALARNELARDGGGAGGTLSTDALFFNVTYVRGADVTPPQFSNLIATPSSPATYSSATTYRFNSTWTDNEAVDNVIITFGGANYTIARGSGTAQNGVYNFSISGLAVGTYNYNWWANDTSGNANETSTQSYTINRATPQINLTLNGINGNATISPDDSIYLNLTQVIGDSGATLRIYLEGELINQGASPLSNLTLFETPGEFNVTGVYLESQNFTSLSETFFVIVEADTTPPNVTLISPLNGTLASNPEKRFDATFTNLNLKNSTFHLWNSTGHLINQTFSNITGTSNFTNLSVVLPYEDTFDWNYEACDGGGNCAFGENNFTISLNFTSLVECGQLNIGNGIYTLQNNVTSSSGVCFNITAENVTLDGNGFTITYGNSASGYGIISANNYTTIKNTRIVKGAGGGQENYGVYFDIGAGQVSGAFIQNNTIITNGSSYNPGIVAGPNFSSGAILENTVTTGGVGSWSPAIDFWSEVNPENIIFNNIFTTYGPAVYSPSGSVFYENNVSNNIISHSYDVALYFVGFENGVVSENIISNRENGWGPGLSLLNSSNNIVSWNNFSDSYVLSEVVYISGDNNTLIYNNFSLPNGDQPLSFSGSYNNVSYNIINNGGIGGQSGIIVSGTHNSVSFNNITLPGSFSVGIQVGNALHNQIFSNNISVAGDAFLIGGNTTNNTIHSNLISVSSGSGYTAFRLSGSSSGNILKNNSFGTMGSTARYLTFGTAGINDTKLVNQYIQNYTLADAGVGGTIIVENTNFGEIKFTQSINGSGNNLTATVFVEENLAVINAEFNAGLNRSANITLYNLSTNFVNPVILKNGTLCEDCYNFTSLNAGTVVFNVSGEGNYSVSEGQTDTCSCPGINQNWEIDMADSCIIVDSCNLGNGNITFIGLGVTTFNAQISTKNLNYPSENQILNIGVDAFVLIG